DVPRGVRAGAAVGDARGGLRLRPDRSDGLRQAGRQHRRAERRVVGESARTHGPRRARRRDRTLARGDRQADGGRGVAAAPRRRGPRAGGARVHARPPARAAARILRGDGPPSDEGAGMLKRAFDASLAFVGLILSAPLWGLFAALVKMEDGGPVFFRQDRVGLGGRTFDALKFRSMRPDAEALTGAIQASEGDPRVTRIGRFMRATAMDELPQLWNILRGDMSFVGPRALRPGRIETGSD